MQWVWRQEVMMVVGLVHVGTVVVVVVVVMVVVVRLVDDRTLHHHVVPVVRSRSTCSAFAILLARIWSSKS